MEVKARAKFIRMAPRKARMVTELVKGKGVGDALNILAFTKRSPAKIVAKLLRSAVANADQMKNIDVDTLFIKQITVDQGPIMKRYRPRAMGRATMIRRRMSHITVVLEESY
ncbi:MAG: 50S ribosomal protein L22 [Proteobacteria bacterium]|nr:50S ribosomal protein L22 [Pseudomonadota bacterium]